MPFCVSEDADGAPFDGEDGAAVVDEGEVPPMLFRRASDIAFVGVVCFTFCLPYLSRKKIVFYMKLWVIWKSHKRNFVGWVG